MRNGLAVTARLASTVPPGLGVLPADAGLPALPPFAIKLPVPRGWASAATAQRQEWGSLALPNLPPGAPSEPSLLQQRGPADRATPAASLVAAADGRRRGCDATHGRADPRAADVADTAGQRRIHRRATGQAVDRLRLGLARAGAAE